MSYRLTALVDERVRGDRRFVSLIEMLEEISVEKIMHDWRFFHEYATSSFRGYVLVLRTREQPDTLATSSEVHGVDS